MLAPLSIVAGTEKHFGCTMGCKGRCKGLFHLLWGCPRRTASGGAYDREISLPIARTCFHLRQTRVFSWAHNLLGLLMSSCSQ